MASGVNVWVTVPSRRSDARLTTKDAFDESGTFYINEKKGVCMWFVLRKTVKQMLN